MGGCAVVAVMQTKADIANGAERRRRERRTQARRDHAERSREWLRAQVRLAVRHLAGGPRARARVALDRLLVAAGFEQVELDALRGYILPRYRVDGGVETYSFDEMVRDNEPIADELREALPRLQHGERYEGGGGGWARFVIEAVEPEP
jgi:hypothetical protein